MNIMLLLPPRAMKGEVKEDANAVGSANVKHCSSNQDEGRCEDPKPVVIERVIQRFYSNLDVDTRGVQRHRTVGARRGGARRVYR